MFGNNTNIIVINSFVTSLLPLWGIFWANRAIKQTTLSTDGHYPVQASTCPQSEWESAQPAGDSRRPSSAASHLLSEHLLTSDMDKQLFFPLCKICLISSLPLNKLNNITEPSSFQDGGNVVFPFLGVPPPLWALLRTLRIFFFFKLL